MSIKSKICETCGTTYQYDDGFFAPSPTCPTCFALAEQERIAREGLERQLERQKEVLEEISSAEAISLAERAEEERRTVAESWKLQAQAKAERADQLVGAGLNKEAITLYQEAIQQDPGNLGAYQGIASAFHQLGNDNQAREFVCKQISLLQFANEREIYRTIEMILAVDSENALWEQFLHTVSRFWHYPLETVFWLRNIPEKALSLYDLTVSPIVPPVPQAAIREIELISYFQYDRAWKSFAARAASWEFEASDVLYALLGSAPREIISLVFEAVQSQARIKKLLGFAVGIESGPEQAKFLIQQHYLQNKTLDQRSDGFREFASLRTKDKLSDTTLKAIRQLLLDWYEKNRPEIEAQIQRKAREDAEHAELGCSPYLLGILGGAILSTCICFSGLAFAYLATKMDSTIGVDLTGKLLILSCCGSSIGSLIVGGIVAVVVPIYMKSKITKTTYSKILSELENTEKLLLGELLEQ
jgi:tetratricopeptide (TPR) repeat protein